MWDRLGSSAWGRSEGSRCGLEGARNSNFSATCKSIYIENAAKKACRVNPSTPKLWRETGVQRGICRIVPIYEPKPEAQNRPEAGLFGGLKLGGECLAGWRLERAKGFEPSTPTLPRSRSASKQQIKMVARPRNHPYRTYEQITVDAVAAPVPSVIASDSQPHHRFVNH
jgi:hypothetical protein